MLEAGCPIRRSVKPISLIRMEVEAMERYHQPAPSKES